MDFVRCPFRREGVMHDLIGVLLGVVFGMCIVLIGWTIHDMRHR